jgi:hypothetical protein
MRCSGCGYHFVLSPKVAPFCADVRFGRAIELASQDGARWYTAEQLHGTIFRRRNRAPWRRIVRASGSSNVRATRKALADWRFHHGKVGPLVTEPAFESMPQRWPEPDLFDYGAEGAVVVDEWRLVDLLVRNHVHTRCKVAVVCGDGYPEQVTQHLRATVESRPDLPIFLLHAADADAASALEQQTRELLDARDNPVTDVGLTVDAAKRIPALHWARRARPLCPDLLPLGWLTEGLALAIAHRVSFVELLQRPDSGADDAVAWYGWNDGDTDFG